MSDSKMCSELSKHIVKTCIAVSDLYFLQYIMLLLTYDIMEAKMS